MENKNGFGRYCSAKIHITATAILEENKAQSEQGKEIHTLLGPEQIEKNRYYVKHIAETVRFLALNGLVFRGSEGHGPIAQVEEDVLSPDGLFINLFLHKTESAEKLHAIVQTIPSNASYTSPGIQNEVIVILGSMIVEHIYKTSEENFFCVKADKTRDVSSVQNVAVVVRFIKDAKPAEHLLGLYELTNLTADHITDVLLQALTDY